MRSIANKERSVAMEQTQNQAVEGVRVDQSTLKTTFMTSLNSFNPTLNDRVSINEASHGGIQAYRDA